MDIQRSHEGHTVRLTLIGKLWHPDDIRNLRDAITEATQGDIHSLIVDLSRLSFMCSLGLGVLVRMFVQLKNMDIELIFLDPKEGIREMIELAGLNAVIRVVSSEDEISGIAKS